MPRELTTQVDRFSRALKGLDQLRRFPGSPKSFWQRFLELMGGVSGAQLALLLRKSTGEASEWQKVCAWPNEAVSVSGAQVFLREAAVMAQQCAQREYGVAVLNGSGSLVQPDCAIGLRLESDSQEGIIAAVFFLPGCSVEHSTEALKKLQLIAHTPGIYHLQRAAAQSQAAVSQLTSVLDLLALLNAERRFLSAAMTLCNEVAARQKCDRVSLGWLRNNYVRLQAMSHAERFEKKMEAVRWIEQTMEEALDQDEVVVWPAAEGERTVTREHERFAEEHRVAFLCSVPLRLNGDPVAVLLCERNSEEFSEAELQLLSLSGEMCAPRLAELVENDRWVGARWAAATRQLLGKAVGVEHTWAKIIAVLIAAGLCLLFFGKMSYRVEAPFMLRTDDLAILTTPFDGYIDEVPVEIGDRVRAQDVLLKLDTREMRLEEASALADLTRFTREAEKARATNALAGMRIAMAQADQARARLDLVRFRLDQSVVRAPADGVVVEGDLKKKVAAPVRQGELLFKVARLDRMYAECRVNEVDVHEIHGEATGQIAFASQPKLKFPVQLDRVEPAAQTKDQKNVFVARCTLPQEKPAWWRPGMSGVAKLDVGKRTFFWVLSHRTIDFLRMYFWI